MYSDEGPFSQRGLEAVTVRTLYINYACHIQEEERPGQEILERIENTSYLLGRSHQIRPTVLQLLQHFQYTGNNIGIYE